MPEPAERSVEYQTVEAHYFAQRGLRPHARVGSLWVLGAGAVISDDFFGGNFEYVLARAARGDSA